MFVWGMGGKEGPALTKTTVTGYPNKTPDPNKNQRVLSDPKKTFRNSLLINDVPKIKNWEIKKHKSKFDLKKNTASHIINRKYSNGTVGSCLRRAAGMRNSGGIP